MNDSTDILIVDDERINLKLIEGILRGGDLNLVLVSSGEEALKVAKDHDFAVALLDVMMPGMDGFELAERLRKSERTSRIPIIFITAISKEQRHIFHGYGLGAVDYLFKPVEPEVLRSKVGTFSELHRKRRRLEETTHRLESTIAALEASRTALLDSEHRYRMVADYNYDWESWIDPDGKQVYVSPSCERITGYSPDRFLEDDGFFTRIVYPDDLLMLNNYMQDTTSGEEGGLEFRIYNKDAKVRWVSMIKHPIDDDGQSLGIRTSIRDVTSRKRMEDQIRHSTLHDPLTGLPNRALFLDRMDRAIVRAEGRNRLFGVLYLNLDRFQAINDHYGHVVGDKVLVKVGVRLQKMLEPGATVARFGSDEFVVMFDQFNRKDDIRKVMQRMRESFVHPMVVDGVEFRLSASFGLDTCRNCATGRDELVRNAQLAMFKAKQSGRSKCVEYNSKLREGVINVVAMENELTRALSQNEFEAYYQPIVNLSDGRLYGFEALARWIHPKRGLVSPGEFIPVAEDTGLIVQLGTHILEEACTTLNEWRKQSKDAEQLTMAVNISARQFMEPKLVSEVEAILKKTGLPPEMLKLEITETVVMTDAAESTSRLNLLKSLGIKLAIDDFGTGYSSMSYLQKFPMDQLKVDLSFVRRMEEAPENIEIVRAIVNMAHSLRLRVVAEGIETERQRDLLYSLQCDYGQGYLYSKPVPKAEAAELLNSLY
jgi:diguanylate cyclase (GGDEF)-like protein/PAS domain S-box-containing protein